MKEIKAGRKTQYGNSTPWSSLRISCSYMYSSFFLFQDIRSLFYLFFRSLHAPYLTGAFSLYSPILFQSQPSTC